MMVSPALLLRIATAGIATLAFSGCTESPFGANEISAGKNTISGAVRLSNGPAADGAYVWLDGFQIGTYADEKGEFQLSLPPLSSQGPADGVTGVFNLYFYIANFRLNSIKVSVLDGEFVYSQGLLDDRGRLKKAVELEQFLDIQIVLEPAEVPRLYADFVDVDLRLKTPLLDSSTVVLPVSFGYPMGAIFLRDVETDKLYFYSAVSGEPSGEPQIIGHVGRVIELAFVTAFGVLPSGQYEVIPQILIAHEQLPVGMLESINADFQEPGNPAYVSIPVRRTGGLFTVK